MLIQDLIDPIFPGVADYSGMSLFSAILSVGNFEQNPYLHRENQN